MESAQEWVRMQALPSTSSPRALSPLHARLRSPNQTILEEYATIVSRCETLPRRGINVVKHMKRVREKELASRQKRLNDEEDADGIESGSSVFESDSVASTSSSLDDYKHGFTSSKKEQKKSNSFSARPSIEDIKLPSLPAPVNSASFVRVPGGLCLFGGVTDSGSSNETWVYDLEKRVWKYIFAENIIKAKAVDEQNVQDEVELAFPYARCGHVGLLSPFDPFRMFIFGGVNIESGAYLSDVWQLSSGSSPSWAEVPQGGIKPTARWHHSATALEDKIFVYGGEDENYCPLRDLCVFDCEKREWLEMRTIFPYPKARQLHSCSRIDGTDSMCVIGGVGIEDINDIWIFDAQILQWREIKPRNSGPFMSDNGSAVSLSAHTSCGHGNHICVFGGRQGHSFSTKNWIFDLVSEKWILLQDTLNSTSISKRWKHMSTTAGEEDDIFVFGGLGSTQRFSDLYRIQLIP